MRTRHALCRRHISFSRLRLPSLLPAPCLSNPPLFISLQLRVDPASLKLDGQVLKGTMHTSTPGAPPLALTVAFYESGIARIRILEDDGRPARWEVSSSGR